MLCFKISCNIFQPDLFPVRIRDFFFRGVGLSNFFNQHFFLQISSWVRVAYHPHPSRSIRLMYFKRQAFMSFLTINSQCTIIISPCTLFANVILLHCSAFSNKMMLKLFFFLKPHWFVWCFIELFLRELLHVNLI